MRVRRGAATAAAVLTALVPATTAASADPAGGIGDPYFPSYGNTGYDVDHYDLRLDYAPDTDLLKGTATLVTRTTEELDSFTLDFLLDVDSVRVNGRPADFSSEGHKLTVDPSRTVAEDRQMTVVVKYEDRPSEASWQDVPSAWHRTSDGAIALGEPEASWWWFPANDHPRDKATFDVRVQVPEGYEAISNGELTGRQTRGGKDIYLWRQDQPAATYLATLAVGRYEVHEDTTASGLPVYNAYAPDLGRLAGPARASIERGGEILEFQERTFGPYPYNALGGVVAGPEADLGYALETQTRPVYSHVFFSRGSNTYVVAHELAHQWWGDHVSVDTWQDIWLNEGFASYAEWMWSEHEGEGTAQELAEYTYDAYPADSGFWTVTPGDPGSENVFHPAVYDRGALAVHALRAEVGQRTFYRILYAWQQKHAHGNATVQDFIDLSEKISGKDLDPVFDTWLFTPERPKSAPGTLHTAAAAESAPAKPESWDTIQRNRELFHDGQHGGHGDH